MVDERGNGHDEGKEKASQQKVCRVQEELTPFILVLSRDELGFDEPGHDEQKESQLDDKIPDIVNELSVGSAEDDSNDVDSLC